MIVALLTTALLAQTAPTTPSPAALLTKTFARYAGAETVTGSITMVQTAEGRSLTVQTGIQIEKPTKVWLLQKQTGAEKLTSLLTSDGRTFSYDPMRSNVFVMKRGEEFLITPDGKPVTNEKGNPLGLGDIYIAMNEQLLDKNPWLDMLFAERSHLTALMGHWASLVYRGRVKVRDTEVHAIAGDWRETPLAKPSADFEMYLNDDCELIRYVIVQRITHPKLRSVVEIRTVWDADLKVGGTVDPSLFKVIR